MTGHLGTGADLVRVDRPVDTVTLVAAAPHPAPERQPAPDPTVAALAASGDQTGDATPGAVADRLSRRRQARTRRGDA